jgi:hypothetical protein
LICGIGATGLLAACGSNSGSGGGAGGSSARGGSTGGSSASGGATGNGGTRATGGSSAAGGSTSSGGSSSNTGSSATGGSSAAGGTSTGSSGAGGSSGPVTLFDFADGDQGWVFNSYQATGDGGPVSPYNLAAPWVGTTDAGIASPTIAGDSTVGDPAGSLKVVVTFTDTQQQVNPNYHWTTSQDWTDKVISVRLKIDPAAPASFTGGGILLFAQDSTWSGKYQWTDFPTDSDWHTYTLDMTGVASPDPSDIVQFTVQISSANTPATDDAGVSTFTPTTVTAYIDTVTIQ